MSSPDDDVRPFVVTALALDHLLARKLRALLVRRKPRDSYDTWLLLRQWVEPDLTLVERKLALYDRQWEREALEEAIESLRAEWEQDRPPLPQFVPCSAGACGGLARLVVRSSGKPLDVSSEPTPVGPASVTAIPVGVALLLPVSTGALPSVT